MITADMLNHTLEESKHGWVGMGPGLYAIFAAHRPVLVAFGRLRPPPEAWDVGLWAEYGTRCLTPSNMDYDCCTHCRGSGVIQDGESPCPDCGGTGAPEMVTP